MSYLHTGPESKSGAFDALVFPTVSIAHGGSYAKVKFPGISVCGRRVKRGEIKGFSFGSSARLRDSVAKVDKRELLEGVAFFCTLTFHQLNPGPRGAKRLLRAFLKRLDRVFPRVWFRVKLEPQDRGYPHFHLLGYVPSKDLYYVLRDWIPVNWNEVCGESWWHLKWHRGELGNGNKHCCDPVRSWDASRGYLAKYMGKTFENVEGWERPGRLWLTHNRGLIPVHESVHVVNKRCAEFLVRCNRRRIESVVWGFRFLGKFGPDGTFKPGFVREWNTFWDLGNGRRERLFLCYREVAEELGREVKPLRRRCGWYWKGGKLERAGPRSGPRTLRFRSDTAERLLVLGVSLFGTARAPLQ